MTYCSCLSKLRKALEGKGVFLTQETNILNTHGHREHPSETLSRAAEVLKLNSRF